MPSDIADRIRKQLSQRDGMTLEVLEPLVGDYSQECEQVNQRLAECVVLLRQGHRSEALQRASANPNLLDAASYLDFPELQEWLDIVQLLGLQAPTLLNTDAAEQLNDAFLEEQPLETLLRRHRQLAIGKAPLAWRLKVLRAIRKTDTANSVWGEDQEQWEIYRLKQIPRQLERAEDDSNLEACKALAEELEQDDWLVQPEPKLVERARASADRLILSEQIEQLSKISDPLFSAFSEQNVPEAKKHYAAWTAIEAEMSQAPPQEISERVEPAIEWLRGIFLKEEIENGHRTACAELEALLEDPRATLTDLESAYAEVDRFGLPMDDLLDERLRDRIAGIHRASRRKRTLWFTSILAVVGAGSAGLIGQQWYSAFEERVHKAQGDIESLLKQNKLQEAQDRLDEIGRESPSILSRIDKLKTKVETVLTREIKERSEFNSMVEVLEESLAEALAGAPEDIQEREVDRLREEVDKLTNKGKDLRSPEDLKEEQQELVRDIELDFENYERRFQSAQYSNAFDKLVQHRVGLEDKVDGMQGALNGTSEGTFSTLVKDFSELSGQYPKAAHDDAKLVAEVNRVESLRKIFAEKRERFEVEAYFRDNVQSVSSLSDYHANLQKFKVKFPGNTFAEEQTKAIQPLEIWLLPTEWEGWSQEYQRTSAGGLNEKTAASLQETFLYLDRSLRIGGRPIREEHAFVLEHLRSVQMRRQLVGGLVSRLEEDVFAEAVTVSYVNTVSRKRNRCFVTSREWNIRKGMSRNLKTNSRTAIEVLSSVRGTTESTMVRGKLTANIQPKQHVSQLVDQLKAENVVENWEAAMIDMLGGVIVAQELDSAVKVRLVHEILKTAVQGSHVFKEAVPAALMSNLASTVEAQEETVFLPQVLSTDFPGNVKEALSQAVRRCRALVQKVENDINALASWKLEFVGAVAQEQTGGPLIRWQVNGRRKQTGAVYALVTWRRPEATQNLVPYGRLVDGEIVSGGTTPSSIPAGTPLFLRYAIPR